MGAVKTLILERNRVGDGGLRALANLFFDVDAWVETTMAVAAPGLAVPPPLATIVPKSGTWNTANFVKTVLELLRPHNDLSPFVDTLNALHVSAPPRAPSDEPSPSNGCARASRP